MESITLIDRRWRMEDDTYFSKALAEYREDSGDDRDFGEMEAEVQHEILKRAQGLKTEREREKRG